MCQPLSAGLGVWPGLGFEIGAPIIEGFSWVGAFQTYFWCSGLSQSIALSPIQVKIRAFQEREGGAPKLRGLWHRPGVPLPLKIQSANSG